MKILITENQLNKIILTESTEIKTLYSDKNIEIAMYGFNSQIGAVESMDRKPSLGVKNISDKPIAFTIQKFNATDTSNTYVSNVKFIDKEKSGTNLSTVNLTQILKPFYEEYIVLNSDKSKDGSFAISFTFFYSATEKNAQPVFKTVRIPIYIRTKEDIAAQYKKEGNCQGKFNQTHLNSAIDWWKKWLNHPTTKAKFARSFKYDNNTVEKHFAQFNKILTQIKIQYVDTPGLLTGVKGSLAYVMHSDSDNIVYVNCSVINLRSFSSGEAKSTFIHEIQHLLNKYHKFYPFQDPKDNVFTYYADMVASSIEGSKKVDVMATYKYLTDVGFSPEQSKKITTHYDWMVKNDELHLKNPNEVMSSLSQIRLTLNLTPDQKITKEMLIANTDKDDVIAFISQWLYSGKSLTNFLDFSNSIAMNKSTSDNRNLA